MIILGIETSCDETAAAVVSNGRQVLSNVIASQTQLHAPFGGVVPEIAARGHIEAIRYIVDRALDEARVTLQEIDGYTVANGPGLAGALLVGLNYGKALSYANKKPLVGVQHIEGHVCANYIDSGLEPPFLCLVVSGGHTIILAVDDYDIYKVVGSTRDDAAGEAFDKVGRLLGLPFPGGPEIDKLSRTGKPDAYHFPRARVDGFDFSFSGLKTAARDVVAKGEIKIEDIAASFQQAVVDVLVSKTLRACEQLGYSQIALAGGVACNHGLRTGMKSACEEKGIPFFMPQPIYCTDNAAMIASRGYFAIKNGKADALDLNAFPEKMA